MLRLIKKKKNKYSSIHCAKCPWFSYCCGCILNPFKTDNLTISENCTIIVDWCNKYFDEEIDNDLLHLKFNIKDEVISQFITDINLTNSIHLKDCIDLFFEKEKLDDELYCSNCKSLQPFYKNYEISKPSKIMVLSLKRFKYNNYVKIKLSYSITYPLYDLEIKGVKYDLFGIIYHYGEISFGHYTSAVKVGDSWYKCNDNLVRKVEENEVINPGAYILIYHIKEEKIKNNKSFEILYSILNSIKKKEGKDEYEFTNDLNLFEGEPVSTEYGKGYVKEDCLLEEGKEEELMKRFVHIKFNFFEGHVLRSRVEKETVLNIENSK